MEDLRERDLSDIPDHQLSAAERRELERRFVEFLSAMRSRIKGGKLARKRRQVVKWDPARHGRKH